MRCGSQQPLPLLRPYTQSYLFRTDRDVTGRRQYLHPRLSDADLRRLRAAVLHGLGLGRIIVRFPDVEPQDHLQVASPAKAIPSRAGLPFCGDAQLSSTADLLRAGHRFGMSGERCRAERDYQPASLEGQPAQLSARAADHRRRAGALERSRRCVPPRCWRWRACRDRRRQAGLSGPNERAWVEPPARRGVNPRCAR